MEDPTMLDRAHVAMQADLQDETAALRYYQVLADTPLLLVLQDVAIGGRVDPLVFDLDEGPVVLAFDTQARLASLGQGAQAYAELPGRVIAQHLAGKAVSLGVNFGCDAVSELLLPPEALSWLAEMVAVAPEELQARPEEFFTPRDLPDALTGALNFAFAAAPGLAQAALLVGVRYDDGRRGHMLAVVDARPEAEAPLARAVAEALRFSGLAAGELDVTFVASGDLVLRALSRSGILFEFPLAPVAEASVAPAAPGTDPNRPPRLR